MVKEPLEKKEVGETDGANQGAVREMGGFPDLPVSRSSPEVRGRGA